MNFKPIDEMSLRQIFSSPYGRGVLRLSYLGPVLGPTGSIETSPDCMILDMREHPFRPLRCEFKFVPSGKDDFANNGRFDIAVVWSLPPGKRKEDLLRDLLQQNGCGELVVLDEIRAFRELPEYTRDSISRVGAIDQVKAICLDRGLWSVFAIAIAARIFPAKFRMDEMVKMLANRFPEVKRMQPRGQANAVSAFLQTKPPLIERMHGNYYRWTAEIDSVTASAEIYELIRANFGAQPPTKDDMNGLGY